MTCARNTISQKGERGKFNIPANKIRLPVYLAPDVELRLRKQAEKMGYPQHPKDVGKRRMSGEELRKGAAMRQ
jgi:hypothetical protein